MRLAMLVLLALPSLAAAQDVDDFMFLGAGGYARPKFEGSSERTVELIPSVRYFGRPWFARTTQGMLEGGAQWNLRPGLDGGVQLAYEPGPLDHDPNASIGLHLEGDSKIGTVPLNGLLRVRQQLRTDRGAQLDARGTVGVYGGHGILAGLYAQATWATEKFFETYYGLHESGLFYTAVGALGAYDLTRRWILFASLESRRVSDIAARSPIVERRSGTYASLSLNYRF